MAPTLLESLLHHVGLPPQLPGCAQENIESVELALTERLYGASCVVRDYSTQYFDALARVCASLQLCRLLNENGRLNKTSLVAQFSTLEQDSILILHISAQNAGLLIRRSEEGVLFEAFEASAQARKVLAGNNLVCDFPRYAASISEAVFMDPSFQKNLAELLEKASVESIKQFGAHTTKAGAWTTESRDVVDPSLITGMLMALLEANGRSVFPPLLQKRVRDDVCWIIGEGANPWRRCAMWMVLRVGIQRHLYTLLGPEIGQIHYKFLLCIMHAQLLDEASGDHGTEPLEFLKTKLCRRLAKLEVDRAESTKHNALYEHMFQTTGPICRDVIRKTTEQTKLRWDHFKKTIKRPVEQLPLRADHHEFHLTLPHSQSYLQQVISEPLASVTPFRAVGRLPATFHPSKIGQRFTTFADGYFKLTEFETTLVHTGEKSEERCLEIASKIRSYTRDVGKKYESSLEQKSIMFLTIMELWVDMEKCALHLYNILSEFSPIFPAEMLNVLHLPRLQDMRRLQIVQSYLSTRHASSGRRHIFEDPSKGCFADRYFDDSEFLKLNFARINLKAEKDRAEKEEDWKAATKDYESLQQEILQSNCAYISGEWNPLLKTHDDKHCVRCFKERKLKRMNIEAYEYPLPANEFQAKAVVFELGCPKAFQAFRNITWTILAGFASPLLQPGRDPAILIRDYNPLHPYKSSSMVGVSLASTKKSYLNTHYKFAYLPAPLEDVCLPNGMKVGYFDDCHKAWTSRLQLRPTFFHHFKTPIPTSSPFASLKFLPDYCNEGPSSYEIVAGQSKCPSGLNSHEFMAYQSLCMGKHQRWPLILIELGSSNLNFSTEATTLLVSQLVLHAGPQLAGNDLRAIHSIFADEPFSDKLLEQLEQRLLGISKNWREINCMGMLITLLLRVHELAPQFRIREASLSLLKEARKITFDWVTLLRIEVHKATDVETSRRCSRYAFWASILCRHTFEVRFDSPILSRLDLQCFIECSIALQDNLSEDPESLPTLLRNALMRDVKMVYRIRFLLLRSIENCVVALLAAISSIIPESNGIQESGHKVSTDEFWITCTLAATEQANSQTIHYHVLRGLLLIDGKPLGKLPPEHAKSAILGQLFPNINLLTYPSRMPGMTYTLVMGMEGHEIHFGFRQDQLVVRARVNNCTLEYIPPGVFGTPANFDLPASLMKDCFHWLDIRTGVVEVRQRPRMWKQNSTLTNWFLDFPSRTAKRRRFYLVDPHSHLFERVAKIFNRFESPEHLTVYESATGSGLYVELRRMELRFTVNQRGLLESQELRSEIDPDQDAGTWYGLNSKLVLREIINPLQRSIIVPMGSIQYKRNGMHVAIDVNNKVNTERHYGRFTINTLLRRLECPAEPWLLYMKAMFHAYTSHVVPDSLTGRTGSEEAIYCLKTGLCQPWAPISTGPYEALVDIASLAPIRVYYPRDIKVMQQIIWNPNLTVTIQREEYHQLVKEIHRKSEELALFASLKAEPLLLPPCGDVFLTNRYTQRYRNFRRPDSEYVKDVIVADLPYARDRSNGEYASVFQTLNIFKNRRLKLPAVVDLAGILQNWPNINGFDTTYNETLLSELLVADFARQWGPLVTLCRSFDLNFDRYKIIFFFGLISYRKDINADIMSTLIAYSVLPELKSLQSPSWPVYSAFKHHQIPSTDNLLGMIKPHTIPYPGDERSVFGYNLKTRHRKKLEAAESEHVRQMEKDCENFAKHLLDQWPCLLPTIQTLPSTILVDSEKALNSVSSEWIRLYQNFELGIYISKVQRALNLHCTEGASPEPAIPSKDQETLCLRRRNKALVTLQDLLQQKPVSTGKQLDIVIRREPVADLPTMRKKSSDMVELEMIVKNMMNSRSHVEKRYAKNLQESLAALLKIDRVVKLGLFLPDVSELMVQRQSKMEAVQGYEDLIKISTRQHEPRADWLMSGNLWPCMQMVPLLETLRSTSVSKLSPGMKKLLVNYAVAITSWQRVLRIHTALIEKKTQTCLEEVENSGHSNWRPGEHTDWLLLEIDSNMLIRDAQYKVALSTIHPASGTNSVLQMNMGQGKTSCIMPMVAAEMADSKKLLRVIVPKSLLLQTAQLLQARLGGLLGRDVRHVPFSRKTPTNSKTIKAYHDIHQRILKSSGIILSLPEHTMSFMLSGLQQLSDARMPEAASMIKIQRWMTKYCRDVLDECDFTLAVKTMLIYPAGAHAAVDGAPHRWNVTQVLLHLIEGHLWSLPDRYRQSIELIRKAQGGGFPLVFLLRRDVEEELLRRLVDDICNGRTSILPTRGLTKADRRAIRLYISQATVPKVELEKIAEMFPDSTTARQSLHLLRGLIVHRILLLCLKRRWNVQYGIDNRRDPIAVPYHAKGVPSDQAEWGHPDVAIILTCLAFYYEGLKMTQLKQSLERLLKSDDPSSSWDGWISRLESLPGSLHEWKAINVDDESQLRELWKHMRYNMTVVDYFLNHFVFPLHAKQFRIKLQASGWDLPLLPLVQDTTSSKSLTTGFSGTNDNRSLMPLTIKQDDLPGLSHTNAEVLTYLLQVRNRQYVQASQYGKRLTEMQLLRQLELRKIRILIDAGAQILEMDNLTLVTKWLSICTQAPAAVYFDTNSKPIVLYRKGHKIPLVASPFVDNLEDCLVYLDEAHCRGTDLKMPVHARGALTLGLGQTKDHTVQAAMRLRQLGTTQAVTFFAPPEVHQSILDVRRKKLGDNSIDSHDVIAWLIQNTIDGLESLQPLHYSQGLDFSRRTQAVIDNPNFLSDPSQREAYLAVLRQTEQHTLEQLYAPKTRARAATISQTYSPQVQAFVQDLNKRRITFQDTGNAVHGSALEVVEQEREVAFEIESVREVQRPTHYSALQFPGLHRDILSYAETGRLAVSSPAFEQAFISLRRIPIGRRFKVNVEKTSLRLFASTEFRKTIKLTQENPANHYQRNVQWVLWSRVSATALMIIPEEAEKLIPILRNMKFNYTYLLSYAAPVTRKMLHFNRLTYYTIPTLPPGWKAPKWLTIEVGIIAGRVFFEHDEYEDLCQLLGLQETTGDLDMDEDVDGFEEEEEEEEETPQIEREIDATDNSVRVAEKKADITAGFVQKPLTFFREWLTLKRKGQDFAHTPMGYVCQGKSLTSSHPFFLPIVDGKVRQEEKKGTAAAEENDEFTDSEG